MSIKVKERRRARIHAVQALYQKHMAETPINELKEQYYSDNVNRHPVDWEFFYNIVNGVDENQEELDQHINVNADKEFSSVNPIELAILRLAIYELLFRLDIPYQVVIKEYVSYTMDMGAEDGHKFVNGLLDKLAKSLRVA
jgi:N utilization substance protein B